MASTSSAIRNDAFSSLPTLRAFAETDNRLKSFSILFQNLKVLIEFDYGQKLTFDKKKKIFYVDKASGFIKRHFLGAFHPNFVNMTCNKMFQTLDNAQKVIEKIKNRDSVRWTELQRIFNLARPLITSTGALDRRLLTCLNKLEADQFTRKEIWALLKAARIAQEIIPIETTPSVDSIHKLKPLEHTFQELLKTYPEGWIYQRLLAQSQHWPSKIQPLCEQLLLRQLDVSKISLPVIAKAAVTPGSSPSKRPRRRGSSKRNQPTPQAPVSSSSPKALPIKPQVAPPVKSKPDVPNSVLGGAVSQMEISKRSIAEILKKRNVADHEIDALVNRQREERMRQMEEESRVAREAAFNDRFNSKLFQRAAENAPELPAPSELVTSWDDVKIESEKNKIAVHGDEEDEDGFLLIKQPVKNVLLRTQSETELLVPPAQTRSPMQRAASQQFQNPYTDDFVQTLMKKFAHSNLNGSDSDDDKWSDDETKPGIISRVGRFFGL